jgi:hypothetical protein
MRPWIAVVASYAVALHLVLTGIAASLWAAEYSFFDGRFAICAASADGSARGNPAACVP